MSQDQIYDVASTHYERLRSYLSAYLQTQRASGNQSNQRTSAREKLTRLTKQQFAELSTDVFDEMNRRQLDSKEGDMLFPVEWGWMFRGECWADGAMRSVLDVDQVHFSQN